MSRRTERLNDLIRDELSELVSRELRDPRLERGVFSFPEVDTTPDFRVSRVYVSVLGSEEEKSDIIAGLASAKGFIHRAMKKRLSLRITPEFVFVLDESMERADRVLRLIDKVSAEREARPDPEHESSGR